MALTSEQIDVIRRQYIRDLWKPAVPNVSPAEGLSHFNLANKRAFISDEGLHAKADQVSRAFRDELSGVYEDEYSRLTRGGVSESVAETDATALQNDAFYRLIRAAVYEDMMLDAGYVGSIADNDQRTALFKTWEKQIIRDRQFTRQRTTPALRSLPLERF
ncbi:MAG TPA: hypothetical protein VF761_16675 [Gemmatimonadaceae bacterium]